MLHFFWIEKSFDSTLYTWKRVVVKICHKDLTHKMQGEKKHIDQMKTKIKSHAYTMDENKESTNQITLSSV